MNTNWRTKAIILGAVLGTVAGIVGAIILVQQAEKNATRPQLSAGDGVKVGLSVLAVLKLLADLGSR